MKILLGTDGSRYARHAARFLRNSLDEAQPLGIDVLAVLPGTGPTSSGPVNPEFAERWADEAASLFTDLPGEVHTLVTQGDPGRVLVERSVDYDLVVVGVKGRGAAPFFELGSTALAVIRHASAPVLLVRPPGRDSARSSAREGVAGHPPRPLQLLLTSDVEDATLETARGLLDRFTRRDAVVELVSVLEPGATLPPPPGRARWSRLPRGEARQLAAGWLDSAVREMGATYASPRGRILEGEPAREIARRAADEASDLIVLGTRCPHAAPGGPLGRTARELAWSAPCSVLLVRAHVAPHAAAVTGDDDARPTL